MKASIWLCLASIALVREASSAFSQMDFTSAITADLSVGWKFLDKDVYLQIEKSRQGFAAFGLATSMSAGDLVVVETANNIVVVKDCHFVGQTTPDCSETQDWIIVEKSLNSSGFKVEVRRSAAASDASDRSITPGKTNIVYAYTDSSTLTQHVGAGAAYGAKVLDFATGAVTIDDSLRFGDGTYMNHEHTQLILWTIGVDILIPVGRHLRRFTRFFDGHSWPLLSIMIISIIFRRDSPDSSEKTIREAHGALSIVLIVLSGLIAVNGLVLRFVIEFDKKPLMVRDIGKLRQVHSILGVLTWAIARATVFIGACMHRDKYGPLVLNLVIAETCLFVTLMALFDYLRWRQFRAKPAVELDDDSKSKIKVQNIQIVQDLRTPMTITQLKHKYPGRNVMIYQNKVFDLARYVHPGGQYIFEECRWREVSRFLQGGVGLERFNGKQWKHSSQAFSALESYYIGDLLELGPNGSDIVLRDTQGHPVASTATTDWYLASRKMTSATTAVLHFKSKTVKIKLTCKGLEWMGRHYTVSYGNKCRPYTNCNAIADESTTYRKAMIEHFEILVNKGKPGKAPQLPEFIDYLPFCIKQYEGPSALSKKLVSADQGLVYNIEGPIGRGIEIPKDFSGHLIIVAGGTGILPFLDLLDFLLKKAIYEICKREGTETDFVQPQQDYSAVFPNAKFTLLAAFRSLDDFMGIDIISSLFGICNKNKLDLFDAMIRVKGMAVDHGLPTTEAHFDASMLQQFTNKQKDQLVLICGPPPMQEALHKDFSTLKVPNENIIFV